MCYKKVAACSWSIRNIMAEACNSVEVAAMVWWPWDGSDCTPLYTASSGA
jgi:hypothetical protein